jgi:hypothetical protein
MSLVKKYNVYCEDEAKYVSGWSETEPTTCFNNNTHVITTNLTSIVDIQLNSIKIDQSPSDEANPDRYHIFSFQYEIGPNETKDLLLKFDVDINMFSVTINCRSDSIGDVYDGYVNKNSVVGTFAETITSNEFKVSSTVVQYASKGLFVNIDGKQHMITNVDVDNEKISILDTVSVTSGDPFMMTYFMMKDKVIFKEVEKYGDEVIGSFIIKQTDVCGLTYYNNSPITKYMEVDVHTTICA